MIPKFGKIYGLCDPITKELRYVGETILPLKKRLALHISSRKRRRSHVTNWIKKLYSSGLRPEIFEIETVLVEELEEAEIWNIVYWKSLGCRLTNTTSGGEGVHGWVPSKETRKKLSQKIKKVFAERPELREQRIKMLKLNGLQNIESESKRICRKQIRYQMRRKHLERRR